MDTQESPESCVLIIVTGGTICMQRSPQGYIPVRNFLSTCLTPRSLFNDGTPPRNMTVILNGGHLPSSGLPSLRTAMHTYSNPVRYAVLEFDELLDSSSIDSKGWAQIACTIYNNYRYFDGFVVLHGTDSLAYASSALSFMLRDLGKPVILTGSQVPMTELQNDAADNLLGSLMIAGHFMIPEVCLFFNNKLYRGNRVTKKSITGFDAFMSPNFPPLASISSLTAVVSWERVQRATSMEAFSIWISPAISQVACLRIFTGIKPEMIDAVLKVPGLKGLVLETFGAGNALKGPDGLLTRVLADAVQKGIVIVNVTQCMNGSVSSLHESTIALRKIGVIPGHDMTSEAALTKLSYLLGLQDVSTVEVTRAMSMSLRGECTAHSGTNFQLPTALLPQPANFTTLTYLVSRENISELTKVLRGDVGHLLHESDSAGNTPLHFAATVRNIEILKTLLLVGASVHLRNKAGHTPMFVAACVGFTLHVSLLRNSGAHLCLDEMGAARSQAPANPPSWRAAGV